MNTVIRRSWPATALLRMRSLEPVRYLAASMLALAVDLAMFSLALRVLGFAWPVAACIGFLAGAGVAYWASVRWVFAERSQREHPTRELAVFVLIGVSGLAITQASLWFAIEWLSFHPELSRLAAAGATFAFNYLVRAALLFRVRHPICELS